MLRAAVGLLLVALAVALALWVHPLVGMAVGVVGWVIVGSALTSDMDLPPGEGGPPPFTA